MQNGVFNRKEQEFYFPPNHIKYPNQFKAMAQILEERRIVNAKDINTQYGKNFTDCPTGATTCCLRRIMYNQPDFVEVESALELSAKVRGFRVLLTPKYHCELIFIEQCWGCAKCAYRMMPPSSKEEDLA